jgi:hypothetical protein
MRPHRLAYLQEPSQYLDTNFPNFPLNLPYNAYQSFCHT